MSQVLVGPLSQARHPGKDTRTRLALRRAVSMRKFEACFNEATYSLGLKLQDLAKM